MIWLLAVAGFAASLLTFFSGFGLGTLLLPVFALFFAAETAVFLTAVVHLANNLAKLALLWRHVSWSVALRFGVPALVAAVLGARLLLASTTLPALAQWELAGHTATVTWSGLIIGGLMTVFAIHEVTLKQRATLGLRWLPLGGALSGFFGGLSGHQGALRSAFLIRAGLGREGFVATGVVIAVAVDLARLSQYLGALHLLEGSDNRLALAAALAPALVGALLGRRLLPKVRIENLYRFVAGLLVVVGLAIAAGLI